LAKKQTNCKVETLSAAQEVVERTLLAGAKAENVDVKDVMAYSKELAENAWDSTNKINSLQRGEAVGIAQETLIRRVYAPTNKGMDQEFIPESGVVTTAKEGTAYEREALHLDTMNQHARAYGEARISGQVRAQYKQGKAGQKVTQTGELTSKAAKELTARLTLMDGSLRMQGIPLVTIKANKAAGIMHASFLTSGDALRVLLANVENADELITKSLQSSIQGTKNIQFQNLSEAVRRVIEHTDLNKPLDAEGLAALAADIKKALTTGQGVPINAKSKAAFAESMDWASKSKAGKDAVSSLVAALTDPKVISALAVENRKMMAVGAILARGDGIRMATAVVETIKALPNLGERLDGFGKVLFEGGLAKIFKKDLQAKLTPERLNVAFAEQNFMLAMSKLDPATIKRMRDEFTLEVEAAKDAAQTRRAGGAKNKKKKRATTNVIKAKANQVKEGGPAAEELAAKIVETPEGRAVASTVEEASLIQKEYIEATYGTIVGGWVKLQGALSNKAAMGGEISARLVGLEHHYLLDATEYTGALAHLVQTNNLTTKDYARIFQALQKGEKLAGKEGEIQKILDTHVEILFGKGNQNKLAKDGLVLDEFVFALNRIGLARFADEFAAGEDIFAFKDYWRKIELEEGENIIEILSKFYAAKQVSLVRPHMAASLVDKFGHKAEGKTLQEAYDLGWKEISDDTILGSYLKTENLKDKVLFPPEVIEKMRALNHYLDYERGFKGNAAKFWQKLDPVVSFLKASNTIWRPGHHAVSTLGNMMVNTVAGVGLRDYAYAIELLRTNGVVDVDVKLLEGILRREIPEGYKFTPVEDGVAMDIINKKTGKPEIFKMSATDLNKIIDGAAGVRITPHQAKDLIADDVTGVIGKKKNAVVRTVSTADQKLAEFSALRDNLFRYALFVKALRKGGPFKDLDDAVFYAAGQVHEFHPTVGTLTGWERKNARRAFYFYTWQKQMLVKMLEMAANQPAFITIPSKMQFAIAEMNGLNPNSFGDPHDPQSMYAAYNSNSVYGPQWMDDTWGAMGIKPSAPQLDVFDSILTKFKTRPQDSMIENIGNLTIGGAWELAKANATPLFKIPAELATGNRFSDMGQIDMSQAGLAQYALDQTSLGSLARWTNVFNTGKDTEYDQANRERQGTNYLFGLRQTFYESPASLAQGRAEMIDYWQKTYQIGKYYEGK
jgi:hypothetical protein